MKIGVAVTTTPNRKEVFEHWIKHFKLSMPSMTYYWHNDVYHSGVSYSKNNCLAALHDAGCNYFFLFDDDCFINDPLALNYYINSGLEHATYTFDRALIGDGVNYREFEKPNGCMMFFTRKCIDTVGGWDMSFTGYGYEHVNLSDRIFNAGITPARYIDIKSPPNIFQMADCETSFTIEDKLNIPANFKLYQQKYYSKEFKPFK